MSKGKGMSGIAARLGVTRSLARQLVASGSLPASRVDGVHVVAAGHIRRYLTDHELLPAWENEGGACSPPKPRIIR